MPIGYAVMSKGIGLLFKPGIENHFFCTHTLK